MDADRTYETEIVIYPETKEQADAMEEYILSGQFERDFERWREITCR